MNQRINALEKGKEAMKLVFNTAVYLTKCRVENALLDLIYLRVSQMNGCAFCLDMHAKDLRAMGEPEQRIYGISAWRELPIYSERERIALAWAESVTNVQDGHVPDDVYAQTREQFSEEEIIDLTVAVSSINTANRLNIAFRTPAGNYKHGMFKI